MMACLGLSGLMALAAVTKEFPAHWGKPPEIQTQDYVELPLGYGHGSSTLKHWINANAEKDRMTKGDSPAAAAAVLYVNNFEKAEIGSVPEDLMVLGGEFAVKRDGTNQFLELPGAPLDSFAVQFGPATNSEVAVNARVLGTNKGRRAPTFGVGLGGVSGWKLQVSPGKKALELLKDQEIKATVNYEWEPGVWTQLHLEIRQAKDGQWNVVGKVWRQDEAEPKAASISFVEMEEPVTGRASLLASPFAGTPIWFDELRVNAPAPGQGASAAR
jgi:hypothetical protein